MRPWPAAVARELDHRRQAVLGQAHGRVLDLDDPDSIPVVAASLDAPVDPQDRYDTIVSTAALVEWPDLFRVAGALVGLLADDGDLVAVEPVDHPGVAGLLSASAGTWWPPVRGRYLSRDVVGTLRSAGLTLADVDRFTVPTLVWPLRRWVQLRAVRIPRLVAEP